MSPPQCAMVHRGTKRKIDMRRRETKAQRTVTCSKRRQTVFSKAADLCRNSGANIAVFVTSPAETSDVIYSFSGYSSASEISDDYLHGRVPLNLYHSCNDISELNIIEDRLQRMKKLIVDCLEKKENSELVSNSDQNPKTGEVSNDVSSSWQIGSIDGQNPNYSEIACIDQNCGEENEFMIDVGELFSEEEIELLEF